MLTRKGALAAALTGMAASMGAAQAQTPAASDDIAREDIVYLEADEVLDEGEDGRYIARGNVEARYGARVLRAEEIIFFPEEGRVIARGDVTILEDDGTVTFAQEAEFSDDFSTGVILDFAARLPSEATIGARVATRSADDSLRFSRAFYTACQPCADAGFGARPTWRLRARKVTRDAANDLVFYRDAVLEIKGVPILYTPFFAHADPSVGRKSGLLMPNFGESSRTGGFYQQPYYINLSQSSDLTLAPRFMDDANPLVAFEYRKRFFSGNMVFTGSATRELEFANVLVPVLDENGDAVLDETGAPLTEERFQKFGEDQLRGHLFGQGAFTINENWLWGFGIESILNEDDLYLLRYEIDDTDLRRGPYERSARRLLSQGFATRQTDDAYFSLAGLTFQSLRPPSESVLDEEETFPLVLPFTEARKSFRARFIGGRVEARASAVALDRTTGVDYRRITLESEWNHRITTPQGFVIEPTALARGDVYSLGDVPSEGVDVLEGDLSATDTEDETIVRALGYVGATFSFPLGRRVGGTSVVIEPIANVTLATERDNDENLVNQDSLSVDLDEATIFRANRSPGFDVWEEGARATVGARGTVRWGAQREASLLLAQSYRAKEFTDFDQTNETPILDPVTGQPVIDPQTGLVATQEEIVDISGLSGDTSDVVAAGSLSLNSRNAVTARLRLSDEDWDAQRIDVDARTGFGPVTGYARYLRLNEGERESLDFGGQVNLSRNFGLFYNANRDLEAEITRRADAGIVYGDNCTQVAVIYKRENFEDPSIGTEESVSVRFTLSTLGDFGAR